jgi:Domain of unknown function (DUF5615)
MSVTTAVDADLVGAPDEEHLAHASNEGGVIVTHDADFLGFHNGGALHHGIVYFPMQSRSLGDVIRVLVLIWEILEPNEMMGHVEHL